MTALIALACALYALLLVAVVALCMAAAAEDERLGYGPAGWES